MQKVAAGDGFSAALRVDGQAILTWGYSIALGQGVTSIDTFTPGFVNFSGALNGKFVTNIVASVRVILALTQDGHVYSWGYNVNLQLGNGDTNTITQPLSPVQVALEANVTQIALSEYGAYALAQNGTLYSWGTNNNAIMIQRTNIVNSAVPIAVNTSTLDSPISSIQATGAAGMIVTQSRKVYGFGNPNYGALGIGSRSTSLLLTPTIMTVFDSNVTSIMCSTFAAVGITSSGKLYTWGSNNYIGFDSDTANPLKPTLLDGALQGKEVMSIAVGTAFTLALTTDGQVYSWGDNSNGCLGNHDLSFPVRYYPTIISTLQNYTIAKIYASESNAAALSTTGVMFIWGSNANSKFYMILLTIRSTRHRINDTCFLYTSNREPWIKSTKWKSGY
jgi:alpha-tubulin suppressor-like RCC1 family protein